MNVLTKMVGRFLPGKVGGHFKKAACGIQAPRVAAYWTGMQHRRSKDNEMAKRRQALLLVLTLCTSVLGSAQAPNKPHKLVVVISLDGFPAYALQDDRLPAPTLRDLAKQGASAEAMTTLNPTVTWPNHTTLVTGVGPDKHHVLFNGEVIHRGPNDPVTVNETPIEQNLVKSPTIFDVASSAGLVTAQVAWPATLGAKSISWAFDENPDANGVIARDLIAQGLYSHEQLQHFGGSPAWRDEVYTAAAIDILDHHTPDLLLFHLLSSDMIQHEHGPRSDAADMSYAFEDDRVKQIVDALKKDGLFERTTILVVSDHGFRVVHHQINLNALLMQTGWAESHGQTTTARAWTLPHGGVAMAYVSDPSRRAELVPQLKTLLSSVEGVDHVYTAEEFVAHGLPSQAQTNQSPDLFLTAKIDYFFDEETTGPTVRTLPTSGEHGYLKSDPDMNAIFIAEGFGIRSGVKLGVIQNTEVAPTIAKILGLTMNNIQSTPLKSILIDSN
jgi:predicted AlkP superfamily pyrophosphatase or phosphodiesterase